MSSSHVQICCRAVNGVAELPGFDHCCFALFRRSLLVSRSCLDGVPPCVVNTLCVDQIYFEQRHTNLVGWIGLMGE